MLESAASASHPIRTWTQSEKRLLEEARVPGKQPCEHMDVKTQMKSKNIKVSVCCK